MVLVVEIATRWNTRRNRRAQHACGRRPREAKLNRPRLRRRDCDHEIGADASLCSSMKRVEKLIGIAPDRTREREPFVNVSSASKLLLYLEFAASALNKAAPRPRKREWTKLAPIIDAAGYPALASPSPW
jgi:hypothetical protein